MPEKSNFRKERFILAQFQRFQSTDLGSVGSWPHGEAENIMVEEYVEEEAVHLMVHRTQTEEATEDQT
jgi:hypothetical protein